MTKIIKGLHNEIGERVEKATKEKQMTYYMLAKESGVPLTTILHIVDGSTKNPGVYTVMRICFALDLSVGELLKGLEREESDV